MSCGFSVSCNRGVQNKDHNQENGPLQMNLHKKHLSLPSQTQFVETGVKDAKNFSATDNGTISPVIQTTNGSRVPSSRPRTDVRPRGKDTMSNAEHKVEQKR